MRLLALVAGVALLTSFLLDPGALPGVPLCPMQEYLGLPCPGCGLTRAFCAISSGSFAAAWRLNPFSYVLYPTALVLLLLPLAARRFPGLLASRRLRRWVGLAPVPLVLCMWLFGLARIATRC